MSTYTELFAYLVAGWLIWIGITSFMGIFRYRYWPLIFLSVGSLLWGVNLLFFYLIFPAKYPWSYYLFLIMLIAAICEVVFWLGFGGSRALRDRGITYRQLFFFIRR